MAGREGLIDTAVKTADIGYLNRRLVKAMEDVTVNYDGTVRNSQGEIIQFRYGEDGMDATRIEKQYLTWPKLSNALFRQKYLWHVKAEELRLEEDRKKFRTFVQEGTNLPVHMRRLIQTAQNKFKPREAEPLDAAQVFADVQSMLRRIKCEDLLFGALIRDSLASKRVIKEYKMGPKTFAWTLQQVEKRYHEALASPGETIGCVAAQSIGEPATQMTLNTFHYAGVSAKNVTLGIPRLKEIINIAKTVNTPTLTVYLKKFWAENKERAKEVQASLEWTTLQHVTCSSEIFYDPDILHTCIEADREFIASFYDLPDENIPLENISPWLLRVTLNRDMMIDKNLRVRVYNWRFINLTSFVIFRSEMNRSWTS